MAEMPRPSLELFGSVRNDFIDELLALDQSVPQDDAAMLEGLLGGKREVVRPVEGRTTKLTVFLSYTRSDEAPVRHLYKRLTLDGHAPWMDVYDILPGMNWKDAIRVAIDASDLVIVCLSRRAIAKDGHIQEEIRLALERVRRQPFEGIGLVPARLEKCDVPQPLRHLQWVDLFDTNGYARLSLTLASERKRKDERQR